MVSKTELKILIVEDNNERITWFKNHLVDCAEIVVATDSKSGVQYINETKFDVVFLDHDLGVDPRDGSKTDRVYLLSGKGTGYEVAQAIPNSLSKHSLVIMHTWNPVGADNMRKVLLKAVYAPFGSSYFDEIIGELKEEKINRVKELLNLMKKNRNADVTKQTSAIITDKIIGGKNG